MTAFEVLCLINIFAIWAFALALMWIVGKMRFSLWKCLVRYFYYKDGECMLWLKAHPYYLYSLITSWLLLYLSLGLLSALYEGVVRVRTEYTIAASVAIWFCLIPLVVKLFLKAYKHEVKE